MTKKRKKQAAAVKAKAAAKKDNFVNFVDRLGVGADNLQTSARYLPTQMITQNWHALVDMYCQSWIIGKIVGAIPEDMIRSGISITGDPEAGRIERVDASLSRLKIWTALQNALTWSRLFGGSAALILIEGQDPADPLRLDSITRGSFKGLLVYDRWQLWPDWSRTIERLGPSYGLPIYWSITDPSQYGVQPRGALGFNTRVHHSRLLRFPGVVAPHSRAVMENGWGLSVVEKLLDRLIAFDTASAGAAALIDKAYLRTIHIDGLREILGGPDSAQRALAKNLDMIRAYQSIEGLTVLDGADKFETTAYSFTGLDQVLLSFGQQLSGAADIPLTRLFGQSPAGLNSSGESDIKTYYDGILRRQESQLREPLTILLDIAYRNMFGVAMPPEIGFTFVPLWQMTEAERATIASTDAASVLQTYVAGLIDTPTALRELQHRGALTSRWQAITDELVKSSELAPPPAALTEATNNALSGPTQP